MRPKRQGHLCGVTFLGALLEFLLKGQQLFVVLIQSSPLASWT